MQLKTSRNGLLLLDALFLLVTLGLMAWTVSVLAKSIPKWKGTYDFSLPLPQTTSWITPINAYTEIIIETVTGFETSFTSVPNSTITAIPYDSVYTDATTRYTTTYTTQSGYTAHYGTYKYGISPTATSTRTVTVTEFQQIRHFKLPS